MSAVIVIEIIVGIVLFGAAVRFAVRDTRQRRAASLDEQSPAADQAPAADRGEQPLSEVTDQA